MTTYALSEGATIRRTATGSDAGTEEVVARGSLADCADILQDWSAEDRASVLIDIDDMDLRYGPAEIEELLVFLRGESAGLSNRDIAEIKDPDS